MGFNSGFKGLNTEFTDFTALKLQETLQREILVLSFHCVCGSAHPFNSSYAYQRLFKG
jgi:hypothetical protein